MESPPLPHVDPESYPSSSLYPSFASTTSSMSLPRPKSRALKDPFRGEVTTATDVQSRMKHPPDFLLGQLSSVPVTQTTVVTTTRYTTTRFPPLVMKAPKHLEELDPKLYPLAASPTPPSIKRFCMDVGGVPTMFSEADNATETFTKIQQEQNDLKASHGVLRSVTDYQPILETPDVQSPDSNSLGGLKENTPFQDSTQARQREHSPTYTPTSPRPRKASLDYSPVSITEAARRARTQPSSRLPSTKLMGKPLGSNESRQNRSSSRLQILQTSTPITPSLCPRSGDENEPRVTNNREPPLSAQPQQPSVFPEIDSQEFQQTLSPQPEPNIRQQFQANNRFGVEHGSYPASVPRPRPSILNTAAAQDASLPSPSLSPVTAAANLQSRRGYFEDAAPSVQSSPEDDPVSLIASGEAQSWKEALNYDGAPPSIPNGSAYDFQPASVSDVPKMLDFFETMPTEMKTYIMYQLLRRCPKPVLHFVADNVNPALKCDFLSLLPLELCQNIIRHLDLKSLCSAAQVSRKWRQIVDTDEKTWKTLFDSEGFDLGPGELERAILEGWGWQHASGREDCEKDLSAFESGSFSERLSSPSASCDTVLSAQLSSDAQQSSQNRRSKRKVAPKLRTSSRKQLKKKGFAIDELALFDTESMRRHIASTDGPYAAAQAALSAVPTSNIGLPSLRTLHLYKSIYRRHHLISANWMQDEVKPRHLAFKAHQRHVVTCLQFDADKVLTGSDDTNINVYDTRTGAIQARLEGHEGGVWALQYVGNTLVSGSTDRSVRVWDIERGNCTHIFQGHTSTVRCLIILMPTMIGRTSRGKPIMMPKEPIIITGSRDSTLRVWKLPKLDESSSRPLAVVPDDAGVESPYLIRVLNGHVHSVRAIAAHGDTLVSGSYDSTVRVWKISTGETVHRLTGHTQKVYSVVLDHERNRCISGSMDTLVKVWSLDTGNVLFNLEGHSSLVGLLDLQRERLVSAAADSTLRIWDPTTGQCKSILRAHTGAITCFQHDGRKVISGSDRNLKMWDVKTGKFVRDLLTDLSGVWQVKFDERRCVAAVQRNSLTYIEVLDFGASRDGLSAAKRGRRIVVDASGREINETGDLPDDDVAVEE